MTRTRTYALLISLIVGTAAAGAMLIAMGLLSEAATPKVGGVPKSHPVDLNELRYPITVANQPGYKGFVRSFDPRCATSLAAGSTAPCAATRPAWRYRSTGWVAVTVNTHVRMYAWPFASGWSWAYDYSRGEWLAMRAGDLLIRYEGGLVAT